MKCSVCNTKDRHHTGDWLSLRSRRFFHWKAKPAYPSLMDVFMSIQNCHIKGIIITCLLKQECFLIVNEDTPVQQSPVLVRESVLYSLLLNIHRAFFSFKASNKKYTLSVSIECLRLVFVCKVFLRKNNFKISSILGKVFHIWINLSEKWFFNVNKNEVIYKWSSIGY